MLLKILYCLIIFQVILKQITGFGSFYYILGGFLIVTEVFKADFQKGVKEKLFPFLGYFLFGVVLLAFNLVIQFDVNSLIMFCSLFWIPLLFFLKANRGDLHLESFLTLHIIIATIAALVSVVEFHVSRDVFGLLPRVGFAALYENYDLFYRTRSFFYSTQINTLFMAFSLFLLLELKLVNSKSLKTLLCLLFLYSLILTGSRTAILLAIAFFCLKYPYKSLTILSPILVLSISYFLVKDVDMISRLLARQLDVFIDINNFLTSDSNVSRIAFQLEALKDANFVFGNGLGSTYSKSTNYINTESYYIQIYSELGLIGLALLIAMFIKLYKHSRKNFKRIIFLMLATGLIVHGLSSPYLFGFWMILFSDGDTGRRRKTRFLSSKSRYSISNGRE